MLSHLGLTGGSREDRTEEGGGGKKPKKGSQDSVCVGGSGLAQALSPAPVRSLAHP